MHDALPSTLRAHLLATNPLSYLRVTRSEVDLPGAGPHEIGAANSAGLAHLLHADAYSPLQPPAMYVYRVQQGPENHTGIVADVDAAAFIDGRVLGHEDVQPARVDALVHHFAAVPMRSELVTLMHRSQADVSRAMAHVTADEPLLTVTDLTGVEQVVWQVPDDLAELISTQLDGVTHYIADGHHRVAATVRRWHDHGSPRGGAVLSVLYPDTQVHLLAFHRLVHGAPRADELLRRLRETAEVRETSDPTRAPGCFGLRVGHRWYEVRPRAAVRAGVSSLDVAVLDNLMRHACGVVSGDADVEYVSELTPLPDAVQRADTADAALFLLCAPTLDELVGVAERGEVMPPKSTYIEPKPRAGVFLRPRQGPVDPRDLPSA